MKMRFVPCVIMTTAVLALAGCAAPGGSIYVPAGGGSRVPVQPSVTPGAEEPVPVWEQEKPETSAPAPVTPPAATAPSYRDSGDSLSPAALSLVREADRLLDQGNAPAAITKLERAQRIAPRSAEVYFKLSEAYVQSQQLGRAEQFALKGLSLAGNNTGLQRAGWILLADIRRARGNVAGATEAEAKASAL